MISIETITGSKYIGTSCEPLIVDGNVLNKLHIDDSSYVSIPADKVVAYKVVH